MERFPLVDTPANYRKRYYKGELPKRDTFSTRELSELPKFVKKRKETADKQSLQGLCPLS